MNTFLLILIGVAIALMFLFFKKSKRAQSSSAPSSLPLDIRNVRVGGVVSLRGVGESIEDYDFVVSERHEYDEDGFIWFELAAMRGAQKIFLEVEDDDELTVALTTKKLELSEVGLTPEQLETFARTNSGSISYQNQSFSYEGSGEADFYKDSIRLRPAKVAYWDFESESAGIGVERWGKGEYAAYYAEYLRPSQYEVFALKA